jgi:hypothetical protein
MNLSPYEKTQLAEIATWRAQVPSVASRALGLALSPFTWLIRKIIPAAAIRSVLDFSSALAVWLTDTKDILRDSGLTSIAELKTHDLETSDALANEVHNWAIGVATTEGGVAGAVGLPGLALDIPAVIVLALRTIHKVGACYGYEVKSKSDKDFILAVLAESGANDMQEKVAALTALREIEVSLAKQSWKKIAETAAASSITKEAGIIGIKSLARQLGINLTKRKALQAIPLVGTVVGASVNGWYLKEVGWSARRAFQERWLLENRKLAFAHEA